MVNFMGIIGVNVKGIFAIYLMRSESEVFEDCNEHSVGVYIVDEALFKLFDRGVEGC